MASSGDRVSDVTLAIAERIEEGAVSRLEGYPCSYCGLPVRLGGDSRHPGYAVVDHVPFDDPRTDGLPDLGVLHRFCNRVSRSGRAGCGRILRRAWLGWVTLQYEASKRENHYGTRHFERLGLRPAQLRTPRSFRRHWQVRKMRCASQACAYYSRRGAGPESPLGAPTYFTA